MESAHDSRLWRSKQRVKAAQDYLQLPVRATPRTTRGPLLICPDSRTAQYHATVGNNCVMELGFATLRSGLIPVSVAALEPTRNRRATPACRRVVGNRARNPAWGMRPDDIRFGLMTIIIGHQV